MDRQLQAPLSSASQILCSQERDLLREVKTLRSAVDAGRVRQLAPIMHDIRYLCLLCSYAGMLYLKAACHG